VPLKEAAALLYGGPWVAERYAAVGKFIDDHRASVDASVREIISGGKRPTAAELFGALHRLEALRREAALLFEKVEVLLLPTAGTIYTREEIEREPLSLNANLGRYTNFVNLLDLAAVAVPAEIGPAGLPFGVTLIGACGTDLRLLDLAAEFHERTGLRVGATPAPLSPRRQAQPAAGRREILLAVVGAHLSGQPLNSQLTSRSARLVKTCKSSSAYRLYALPKTTPPKPGLALSPGFSGAGIELEVWALGEAEFGSFVAEVPPPMTIGTVTLDDESQVKCFFCEPYALEGATEITAHGGWRAYLASRQKTNDPPS
jgi:allophanate hydrolase